MSKESSGHKPAAPPAWIVGAIVFCFFLSGLTSLVLETAWSKSLSYLLGTDLYGAATTIIAYMGGLGLGSLIAVRLASRLGRPLRAYALLQVAISICGLVSIPVLLSTQPLFELLYRLSAHQGLFLALRFLVTFLLLLPATTLMGMTLPVVIGAHGSARLATPATAGLLYGLNTLGAVAGTLLAGFALVPRIGLLRTCLVAGCLDLAVALAAFLIYRKLSRQPDAEVATSENQEGTPGRKFEMGVGVAVGLSGVMALALELCWFRLLGQVIGPTVQAFGITLAVFLTGVGIGSLVGSRVGDRFKNGETALLAFLGLGALGAVVPVIYIDRIPGWYQALWAHHHPDWPELSLVVAQGLVASTLMLPATLLTGAVFPAAVRAYRERVAGTESISSISGKLFFVNTVGSALGTLVWAFWLVPLVGVDKGIRWATGCALLGAVFVLLTRPSKEASEGWFKVQRFFAPALFAVALCTLWLPSPESRALHEGVFATIRSTSQRNAWLARPMHEKAKVEFHKEGLNASVVVVSNRHGSGGLDLAFSGKWVASTNLTTRRSLLLLGHLPMLMAPKTPKTALVIGLGTGITTGSLLRHGSLESLDLVEIEPAVLEASDFFHEYNHSPLKDPRTHVILQDGRTYVAFGNKKYDVITSDPIHPWVKGAANLYTVEYYQHARRRLNAGGIFCQWIPSTMSVRAFRSILRTIHEAFPHVKFLFADREVVALASLEPIEVRPDEIRERMKDPDVQRNLGGMYLSSPEKVLKLLEADLHPISATNHQLGDLNTDDNVLLEHLLPWDTFHGHVVRIRPSRPATP